eukprot:3354209-Lingulodinium_polyedra.AAC.1
MSSSMCSNGSSCTSAVACGTPWASRWPGSLGASTGQRTNCAAGRRRTASRSGTWARAGRAGCRPT